MKKYKVMMVAVLGVIALVLGFLLMPAAATTPSSLAEEGAGGGMPIGTEVVLDNSTVATYLGKTPAGSYEWQATFTTSSSDGSLGFYPATSYSVARKATTATFVYDYCECAIIEQDYAYDKYYIWRSFVYFDTASLPSGASITSATLRLFGECDASYQDFYIQIQSGMPGYPHDPMLDTDYNKNYYSGNGGQLSTVDFVVGSYNEIELTSEGISWINTEGWTKFCLRSSRDINPFGQPTGLESVSFYTYEAGAAYRPKLVVTYYETPPPPPPPTPLLEKYAPVLYFHPNEDYYTDSIDSMLKESDLENIDNKTFSLTNPTTSQLSTYNTNKYYMDVRDAEPGFGLVYYDGSFSPVTAEPPDPSRFTDYTLSVYGRQVNKTYEGHSCAVLQYWLFYPYNSWWNCHEGDWERIQIIYDKVTETPIKVTFGQHRGGETVPWDGGVSLVGGTHPKVFAAVGSHASYPTKGLHPVLSFTDYTSEAGTALLPEDYTLIDISGEPSWVGWLGKWGCFVPGDFSGIGRCGPDSPANVVINKINVWDDPIAWADDPGSPSVAALGTGPMHYHAYDSQGNHTGLNTGEIETEIPGTYFYIPGNQSDELMWIYTEENLTFTIEATGAGEANFSLAKSQSDEVTADYSHVEVTENTTAKVDTSQTPIAVMQIDFDGDGRFDRSKFPDGAGNSTLVGKVSFLGRGDPPNDRWIETFVVRFFEPSTYNELSWSPLYSTTNSSGYFTITGLPAGTYDIGIKGMTSLSEMETNVTLHSTVMANFGTTREGDATNDDYISGGDYSMLSAAWSSYPSQPNWDAAVDFNRDSYIGGSDYSALSYNWLQWGDLLGA